ncbi:MAG: hypothetical protein ACLFP9_02030 [Desulfonatronovibrio sp.]
MNKARPVIFCILFTFLAVWGQYFFHSVDFLAPGVVVLLQFGLLNLALWTGIMWMLIQEGTGGFAFGAMIMFYLGLLAAYYLGGAVFEVGNKFFVLLLFLFLAVYKNLIVSVMASLQDLDLSAQYSIEGVMVQTGVYFFVWLLIYNLFKIYFYDDPA